MRPSFHPRLINDPFSDPGLFVPFLYQKRALMFDLGDLHNLSARDLLKVTHVFVTHTHMDHFIGFDSLLRIFLGREKEPHIFGPPDFLAQVEGKLAGYTWNLVDDYDYELRLRVTEVHSNRTLTRLYVCHDRFQPASDEQEKPFSGILWQEPTFRVETALLDHQTPCLGFSLREHFYVNISNEALRDLGLSAGPWLNRFKTALYEKWDSSDEFVVRWEEDGRERERGFVLGDLAQKIARISPGQKITYITDIIGSIENRDKVLRLAENADQLFIEATFLDREKEIARRKYHLTAREAGAMARRAGVKQITLFHFSPRYSHHADELEREARAAFQR
jgi:ribonuclease Z